MNRPTGRHTQTLSSQNRQCPIHTKLIRIGREKTTFLRRLFPDLCGTTFDRMSWRVPTVSRQLRESPWSFSPTPWSSLAKKAASRYFSLKLRIPYIPDITYTDLARIMQDEYPVFEAFRKDARVHLARYLQEPEIRAS